MMKQSIVWILLVGMLLTTASCGGSETMSDVTNTASEATDGGSEDTGIPDNLPVANYDGYVFRIFTPENYVKYYDSDEVVGEVVSDSIYSRNRTVEERFNVEIEAVVSGYNDLTSHTQGIVKNIMANEDFCDLTELHSVHGGNISLQNALCNLHDIRYLDFTKPWWFPQTVEEMTFMDKMYLGCNTISYEAVNIVSVMYVNLNMYSEYQLDAAHGSIYDVVRDGKWTLDRMITMSKDVYRDVNGNGQRDEADVYGMYANPSCEEYWTAFQAPILQKNADTLEVVAKNDKVISIVEKMYSYFYETDSTWVAKITDWNRYSQQFAEQFTSEKTLLMTMYLSIAADNMLREAPFDFGILPLPKYDEAQEDYRCFAEGAYVGIPITNPNTDRTGLILEAMTAEGYRQIIPAYQEIALKDKYLRDEDSAEMFALILESYTASFAFNYDGWKGFAHLFGKIFKADGGSRDVVSYLDSNMGMAKERANIVASGFQSND
ncbi:MAG: hypothetical protein J6C52_01280 [Clostridia bacterium]|nr:hypothetical protein [Clostridia bacterium]